MSQQRKKKAHSDTKLAVVRSRSKPSVALANRRKLLAGIQREIQREHLACLQSANATVLHAIAAGRALLAAKELVGHGQWLPWLQTNFTEQTGLTERTAQRYTKVAKYFLPLLEDPQAGEGAQTTSVSDSSETIPSDMTMTDALRLIAAKTDGANSRQAASSVSITVRTNEWLAPSVIVEATVSLFGTIDFDLAAAVDGNNIPAKHCYTRQKNALAPGNTWTGTAFINPGFQGDLMPWVTKALEHFKRGELTEAILILPAVTDSPWARLLAPFPRAFLPDPCTVRLANKDATGKLPKPLMIVYLAPNDRFGQFAETFQFADVFLPVASFTEGPEP